MEDLEKELNSRIEYVTELAKQIPFYAKKSEELGINLNKIKCSEDLLRAYEKGFCVTKEDFPKLITNLNGFRHIYLTSGTTGKSAIVETTNDDMERCRRQCQRGYSAFLSKSDAVLNCFPSPPVISGDASKAGATPFPIKMFHAPAQTLRDADSFLNHYNMFRFNVIFGLTTSLYRLPFRLSEKGIRAESLKIKGMMTAAEPSTVERRKKISEDFGGANVFDWYASTENLVIGYERNSFSNEYEVTLPETLMFLTNGNEEVKEGKIGNVVITNLYRNGESPGMILLNYNIGDSAKCLKKNGDIVTHITDIRRESAYLSGAKMNPIEVEKIIESKIKIGCPELTGEYTLINYHSSENRKAILEVRVVVLPTTSPERRESICKEIENELFLANTEVYIAVKEMNDASVLVRALDEKDLNKGFENLIKPGKPKRLLVIN